MDLLVPHTLSINGNPVRVEVSADTPLLWVVRDHLGLTGSKFGCGRGMCGACTMHLDGVAVRSCLIPVSAVGKARVTTIEGLAVTRFRKLQETWAALNVPQCGYCQSGQIMQAAALLRVNPRPVDADIDAAMDGNLCRCGTYPRIRAAIHLAAAELNGKHPGNDDACSLSSTAAADGVAFRATDVR